MPSIRRLECLVYRQGLRLRLVRKYAERGLAIPQFLLASWESLNMSISEWKRSYQGALQDLILYDDVGVRPVNRFGIAYICIPCNEEATWPSFNLVTEECDPEGTGPIA